MPNITTSEREILGTLRFRARARRFDVFSMEMIMRNFGLLTKRSCVQFQAGLKNVVRAAVLTAALFFISSAIANPTLREVLPVAQSGDARAQYIAGMIYLFGDGTRQNITEAVRWLQSSARAGMPQAIVALAGLYDVGQGVPFDADRAMQLRQQAARAGDPTARAQLADDQQLRGQRDFRRASILTDLKQYRAAIPYATAAADAGSANAQLLLGRAYHFGLGVPVDHRSAAALYQRSADGGLVDGNRALAYVYEFGLGVGVDHKKALVYSDRAAAKGSAKARRAAANLRSPDYYRPPQRYGADSGSSAGNFSCVYGVAVFNQCFDSSTNVQLDQYTGLPK